MGKGVHARVRAERMPLGACIWHVRLPYIHPARSASGPQTPDARGVRCRVPVCEAPNEACVRVRVRSQAVR
eukprot:2665112-Prymnesium_polylepis.1